MDVHLGEKHPGRENGKCKGSRELVCFGCWKVASLAAGE